MNNTQDFQADKGGVETIRGMAIKTYTEAGSTLHTWTPDEPTREQWLALASTSGALDFWNSADEDIYSETDGEPA